MGLRLVNAAVLFTNISYSVENSSFCSHYSHTLISNKFHISMPDTAVLVTKVPGELQLYFASIVQQTIEEAKITLITGHKLNRKPKPTYVALRQNYLVYLVGKLYEVKRYEVVLIHSLLKDQLKAFENYDFLEAVILNDIALGKAARNYLDCISEKNEKEEDDLEEEEDLEEEGDPVIESLVESTAKVNITQTPQKPTLATEVNAELLESTDVTSAIKLPADRTSFSSEKRSPPSDISSWHVFFPQDVIQGMTEEFIKKAIANIREHQGYSDLMHLVNQSKLSASFLIRKVLHLRKKAINLVTICDCKITLMRIADGVHLEKLNYLNLSDIMPVKDFGDDDNDKC